MLRIIALVDDARPMQIAGVDGRLILNALVKDDDYINYIKAMIRVCNSKIAPITDK